MSKNNKLEKAYRDLQIQEVPDLWNRIESNLTSQSKACEKPSQRKQKTNRLWAGAAAVCAAAIVAGAWKGTGGWEQKSESMATMAEETIRSANEQDAEGAGMDTAAGTGGTQRILQYDGLSLMGAKTHMPAGKTTFVPEDQWYFTEEILKDTELLSQVSVDSVSYEKDEQGNFNQVVYEIRVDQVLYSEDYVREGQKLLVESPLIGNGREALYAMKEGGRYILPLKAGESAYHLIFSHGPQIEVTKDQGYVFHNGFRSLVNEETSVVIMGENAKEDYYYDRMVFRDDTVFLSNLTHLVESKQKDRKQV